MAKKKGQLKHKKFTEKKGVNVDLSYSRAVPSVIHGALWTYIVPDDGSMPDFPTSGNPRSSVIDSNKKLISSAASPLTDKHKYPRKGEYCTILITWDHNDPPKSTDRIADLRKVTRGAAFIEITD